MATGKKWAIIGGIAAAGAAAIPIVSAMRRKAMRVTTILKKDHRVVSGMLMTLEMAPRVNGTLRRVLFDQLYRSVMAHERAEDEVLYPAVYNTGYGQSSQEIERAKREQSSVKDLLDHAARIDAMSDEFDSRLRELKRAIQDHANREERYVFTSIENTLSTEHQERLGRRLQRSKREFKKQIAA